MIVNVTLDGFVPNDNKLTDAGNGIYTYTVTQSGEQEFKVKASGKDARTCYVTLESINNKFITETIDIEQESDVTYSGRVQVKESQNFSQTTWNQIVDAQVDVQVDGASEINVEDFEYKTLSGRYGGIAGIEEFSIGNLSITGEILNENTNVRITITLSFGWTSYNVTYTKTINELNLSKQ